MFALVAKLFFVFPDNHVRVFSFSRGVVRVRESIVSSEQPLRSLVCTFFLLIACSVIATLSSPRYLSKSWPAFTISKVCCHGSLIAATERVCMLETFSARTTKGFCSKTKNKGARRKPVSASFVVPGRPCMQPSKLDGQCSRLFFLFFLSTRPAVCKGKGLEKCFLW